MSDKEFIKSIIRELVTDRMIEECVKDAVEEKIEYMFDYQVKKSVESKINEIVGEKSDGYIREAVEQVINGKVNVNDGWGRNIVYGSFEDLVRKKIAEKLNDGWNVERKVKDAVDAKIKAICEEVKKNHVDNMAEQVFERLGEGKK